MIHVAPDQGPPYFVGVALGTYKAFGLGRLVPQSVVERHSAVNSESGWSWVLFGANFSQIHPFTMGAYAPARALSYIDPRTRLESPTVVTDDSLGFEATSKIEPYRIGWSTCSVGER